MPGKKVKYHTDSEEFKKQIGRRIKALRVATGMAQDTFAIAHDIDRRTLQRMESGHEITLTTLHRFLKAVDIPPAEFFSEGFD
jgi:transcriptional regulator with XRE-family HTH domain